MRKTKWIIGLTIAGIMALSGTALALTTGTSPVKAQLGTSMPAVQNMNPNATYSAPSSNGYGMMGGQGGNGYGSGYGMMGGQGGNW